MLVELLLWTVRQLILTRVDVPRGRVLGQVVLVSESSCCVMVVLLVRWLSVLRPDTVKLSSGTSVVELPFRSALASVTVLLRRGRVLVQCFMSNLVVLRPNSVIGRCRLLGGRRVWESLIVVVTLVTVLLVWLLRTCMPVSATCVPVRVSGLVLVRCERTVIVCLTGVPLLSGPL